MLKKQDSMSQAEAFALDLFETVRAMSADTAGVTRPGYSEIETQVLERLCEVGESLGMSAEWDGGGNLWLRRPGRNRDLPAFVTGSHADSVPQGGNYDGYAGIVAGLTLAWRLHHEGLETERDFVVLAMRAEESAWFGKPYLGSAAILGKLKAKDLALTHRETGKPLSEYMQAVGLDTERLLVGKPLVDLAAIGAFVELHIEQGPMLEEGETAVGIVTGIRGNVRHRKVRCAGEAGHSGAVPKRLRHDPVLAAADLLSRIEEAWDQWLREGRDLVYTTGVLSTDRATHAISVIPGEVSFTVEARSLSHDTVDRFLAAIRAEAQVIGAERGVTFEFDEPIVSAPADLDPRLMKRLARVARDADIPYMGVPSGAGHDAALFANAGVPTAMIFVRNQNGSHNPHEAMEIADFMLGCELLWQMLVRFEEKIDE